MVTWVLYIIYWSLDSHARAVFSSSVLLEDVLLPLERPFTPAWIVAGAQGSAHTHL